MGISRSWSVVCAVMSLAIAAPVVAQPLDVGAVPAELREWIPWVQSRNPDRACVQQQGESLCVWPSMLDLSLTDAGGTFRLRVESDARRVVHLPGDLQHWPTRVRVNGKAAVVLQRDGMPVVELPAGTHAIDGALTWNALPETLRIPPQTALIALNVRGTDVSHPRRNEHGQLWLSGGPQSEREGEQLEIEVFRHVQDAVPLLITTQLQIRASGRVRETQIDNVLLPGTTAFALDANLPARLDREGKLTLQLRAGTFQVTIIARTQSVPDRLERADTKAPWPATEAWVFAADENLRQVQLGGALGVDPAQTNLPEQWRHLPAFIVDAASGLTFTATRRGQSEPPPNRLTLHRELWLDLDGTGYTVRDTINGEMHADWRINLSSGRLGRVHGHDGDQLITELDDANGVELRHSQLSLEAEWREEAARTLLPAVGWSADVQSLSANLHLPPGWTLWTVEGVDHVSNTWLQGWDLFRFFFVLMVALAAGRMFGVATGALALATLVICHQQPDAPSSVWLSLLAVLGLLRVIPAGQWRTLMRGALAATLLVFAVIVVPFAVGQIRHALYPQLATSSGSSYDDLSLARLAMVGGVSEERMAMEEAMPIQMDAAMGAPAAPPPGDEGGSARGRKVTSSIASVLGSDYDKRAKSLMQDRDPNAIVQTGPGVPERAFSTWSLRWSGPVERSATITLWLIPPWANRLLAIARVLLVGLLLYFVIRRRPGSPSTNPSSAPIASGAAAVIVLGALLLSTSSALADTPPSDVLAELERRLNTPAACAPQCLSVSEVNLIAKGNELRLTIEVHAGDHVAYQLPGPASTWVPSQVLVDGRTNVGLSLSQTGHLLLRLSPGSHGIELRGPLSVADSITLALGDIPRRVVATVDGWEISGIREDGTVDETVQLSRTLTAVAEDLVQSQAHQLPPWLQITRELSLGVTWQVSTRVQRISPTGSPVHVRVPLLPGEAVNASDLQIDAGHVVVTLGRDAKTLTWTSTLAIAPSISLTAPVERPWSELWTVQCGRTLHCSLDGTPPIRQTADGQWWPAFRPWPGETLTIDTQRPKGVEGQSTTIDRASLTVSPGVRMRTSALHLSLRSSTGGVRTLSLPTDAKIQEVAINGARVPARFQNGQLALGLSPGQHDVRIEWQEPGAMGLVDTTPSLGLGGPAANVHVTVNVPDERWLLWLRGPSWGPAILFWGFLSALVLLSWLLARVPHSPLRAHQWVLLTMGLTQIDTVAQLLIAGWFFALAYRAATPLRTPLFHNLGQLVLVGWTLAALSCMYWALHSGLLFPPDMQVQGSVDGAAVLTWYTDRVAGNVPAVTVVSVSIWVWRLSMLAWALWLAASLLRWLPWAWRCFVAGGGWRPFAPPAAAAPLTPAAAHSTTATPADTTTTDGTPTSDS